MYDALTARYTFACPLREQAHVALSSFRLLERLPGAIHPAVYEVRFDCSCGGEHPGRVSHETRMLAAAAAVEADLVHGWMDRTRETLEQAERRERHMGLLPQGTRERVPGRERFVHRGDAYRPAGRPRKPLSG